MYKVLVFIIMITAISYGESTNKQFIKNNFPQDKCLNFNENYICLNGENKTNKLSNLIKKMKKIDFFTKTIDINEKKITIYLSKKLKISKEKIKHSKAFIYTDDKGKNHQFNGTLQLSPIYNEKLSNEFNQALFQEEKDTYSNNLRNLDFESIIEPIFGLIRKNSFIVRFKNNDSITIHLSKDFYNFCLHRFEFHNFKLIEYPKKKSEKKAIIQTEIYTESNVIRPPLPPIVVEPSYSRADIINDIDILNEIIIFFKENKNKKIDNKGTIFLNKKVSYLLTKLVKDILYDGADPLIEPFGEGELYLYQRIYQLFVDYVYLSKKEQKLFFNKISGFNSQFMTLVIEKKIIKKFYQKNPIKVFITQTDRYHSPFTDGLHGYLYINHSDIEKIKNNNIRKYLFMHEKEHILQHFKSPKNKMKNFTKNIKMYKIVNQLDVLFNIIEEYDDYQYIGRRMFQKEMKKLHTMKDSFRNKVKVYETSVKKDFLISLNKIDLNKILSPFEEINIDIKNINQLNIKEQYQYYLMLRKLNKRSYNLRLHTIEKYINLTRLEEQSKYQKDFSLIKIINNIDIQSTENGEENTNDFIVNLANEIYNDIDKLRKSKQQIAKKIVIYNIIQLFRVIPAAKSNHKPLKKISFSKKKEPLYPILNQLYNMNELQIRLNHLIDYMELKKSYEKNYSNYINTAHQTGEL